MDLLSFDFEREEEGRSSERKKGGVNEKKR